MLEAGLLEEVRVEQHPQRGGHVEIRVLEDPRQGVDRLGIARRLDRPRGHLRLVGDKEIVQVPADEASAGRLLYDDVDDVFAVQLTLMTKEGLLAVIVVFRAILELPGESAIGRPRDLGLEGPAGEGARRFANVGLGVVAGAEAEQLEEFATPVLVDRGPMVLLVVEPEDHRRVSGHLEQQVAVTAKAALPEDIDLLQQLVVIVDLGIAGGEHMVPEQGGLLFEGPLGVDQVVHPIEVAHRRLSAGQQRRRLIAQQRIGIDRWLRLGVEQFLHRRLVALGRARLDFVAVCAKAGPPHQVRHQSDVVFVCHLRVSFFPK